MKVLYLVATARRKNRSNLTGQINGWKHILNTYHALWQPHRPTREMTTRHVIYTRNVTVPIQEGTPGDRHASIGKEA